MSQTVLFIHGGWVTPSCWDPFVSFFEASGYRCLAPAWPGKDRSVEAIRADPSPLAGLGIGEIVDHYDRIVRELDEPPILIGHSFGGLFVQLLLDRGLGAAGVAIDSAPPKGVFVFDPTSLLSVGRILLIPFGWRKVVRWTFTEFRYAFVPLRLRPHDAARRGTGDLGGPGRARFGPPLLPERVLDVRFREPGPGRLREPESGAPPADRREADHAMTPAIVRRTFRAYRASPARTELCTFPGRTHWLIAQDGWEAVAQGCLDWIGPLRAERTTITPSARFRSPERHRRKEAGRHGV
jgi:pimeloyl-ACP methyl ester carboxylesterase